MKSATVVHPTRFLLECIGAALRTLFPNATIYELQSITALLDEAAKIAPDIIFMVLPEGPAQMSTISAISDLTPRSKIILIADQIPEYRIKAVLRLGIHGLLRSQSSLKELAHAIDEVEHNRLFIDQELITHDQLAKMIKADADSLTPRELETLDLLLQGLPTKEIARKIIGRDGKPIADQTVKTYLSNIYAKLHVSSREEAIIQILNKRKAANEE